jgi:hypothetical protein
LNEGKIDTRWQQFIKQLIFKTTSAYGNSAVGIELFINNVAFAFMFPNAELF